MTIAELLDRLENTEEGSEQSQVLKELAEMVLSGFRPYPKYRPALLDEAQWRHTTTGHALHELAVAGSWVASRTISKPVLFVRTARQDLERALSPRRMSDDPHRHVALTSAVPTISDASSEIEARLMAEHLLSEPSLTDGERAVLAVIAEHGPRVTARDIALETGFATGSVRQLRSRARAKLETARSHFGRFVGVSK